MAEFTVCQPGNIITGPNMDIVTLKLIIQLRGNGTVKETAFPEGIEVGCGGGQLRKVPAAFSAVVIGGEVLSG